MKIPDTDGCVTINSFKLSSASFDLSDVEVKLQSSCTLIQSYAIHPGQKPCIKVGHIYGDNTDSYSQVQTMSYPHSQSFHSTIVAMPFCLPF